MDRLHTIFIILSWSLVLGCNTARVPVTDVHIFAAASLTEGFASLADAFEKAHPEARVHVHVGGSQVLAMQIEQGAGADVFASANDAHIHRLANKGILTSTMPLATNRLTVIIPNATANATDALEALANAKNLVVGHPAAPIGQYTESWFKKLSQHKGTTFVSQIRAQIVSQEKNVRLVRAKVAMGIADAAIVYATDAINQTKVVNVPLPDPLGMTVQYHIGLHKNASPYGRLWYEFAQSKTATTLLKAAGFGVAK